MKLLIKIFSFLIILGPIPNSPLGSFLDIIQLSCIILLFSFLLFKKHFVKNNFIQNTAKYAIFPLFYIILIGFPLSLIINSGEFNREFINTTLRPARLVINFFGVWALVSLYKEVYKEEYFTIINKHIVQIIVLNGVIMICQLLIPSVNMLISNLLYSNIDAIHFQTKDRVGGLYLSGGAIPSMYQAIPLVIIPFLVNGKKIKLLVAIIYFFILIISIVITGRSGLLLLPISILIMLKDAKIYQKLIVVGSLSVLILFLTPILIYFQHLISSTGNDKLTFNFERFLTLTSLGDNSNRDNTIQVILSKFSLPDNLSEFLFGNLNFSNYKFTDVSDMGYNLSLYKFGIIGFIFYYSSIVYMVIATFRYKYIESRVAFFVRCILVMYLLLELKESVIYARNGYSIILMIFFSSALLEKESAIKIQNSIKKIRNMDRRVF